MVWIMEDLASAMTISRHVLSDYRQPRTNLLTSKTGPTILTRRDAGCGLEGGGEGGCTAKATKPANLLYCVGVRSQQFLRAGNLGTGDIFAER